MSIRKTGIARWRGSGFFVANAKKGTGHVLSKPLFLRQYNFAIHIGHTFINKFTFDNKTFII